MAILSNLAGVARVSLEASTGQFNADITQAERVFKDRTAGMSDASLKLELANERLRRSFAKGPAAAQSQARALLAVRAAERELASEAARTSAVVERQERGLGRLRTGAASLAGSAGFGGLRTSIAGFAGGLLAGGGVLFGLQRVIAAAKESEVVLGQTQVATTDAGIAWEKYSGRVQAAALRISRASAFDDEQVLQSFAVFVRAQRNVQESLNLAALAADVARGRYVDLSTATELVNKAALGQIGALRRVGIEIDSNATATEALTALQKAYGGAATKYANSAAGSYDRLRVSLGNLAEATGGPLLHGLATINDALAISIDRLNALGVSSDVAAAKLKNPAFDAGLGRLNGPGVNLKTLQQQFASATLITAPGEGFVRPAGGRGNRDRGGSDPTRGLSRFQRLTLAASQADLSGDLQRELESAKDLQAYYAGIASNEKLKGDALFKARQDLYAQQARVQGIEDQIAADRQQAVETASRSRAEAAERRRVVLERSRAAQRAAAEREERQQREIAQDARDNVARINKALRDAKSGRELLGDLRSKTAKPPADASMTREEFSAALRDAFVGFGQMIDRYYGNVDGGGMSTATLEHLTRQTNGILSDALSRPQVGFRRVVDEAAMQT